MMEEVIMWALRSRRSRKTIGRALRLVLTTHPWCLSPRGGTNRGRFVAAARLHIYGDKHGLPWMFVGGLTYECDTVRVVADLIARRNRPITWAPAKPGGPLPVLSRDRTDEPETVRMPQNLR